MKNVLNLCKCNVRGGAEYSSQVIYDGGSVECIPNLVGENLSVVLERIGEFVCGLGIQMITTNEFEPSNEFGKNGDIHIREQEESIDLYQKLNGEWALVGSFPIGGGGGGVGDFVTINTDQFGLTGTKEWQGRHYFENTLAIPRQAPIDPLPDKAYIYVGPGSGAIPPEMLGNLEGLQNVADIIPNNKFLYKGSDGIWVGADMPATIQNLVLGSASGEIQITGGNSVNLTSLNSQNKPVFESNVGRGLAPITNTTGSTGYPNPTGAGIRMQRGFTRTSGDFEIWKSAAPTGKLMFNRAISETEWNGWQTFASEEWANETFVTQATEQLSLPGNKGWTGRHHFDGSLAIPQAAPVAPDTTKAYIYVGAGSGATPPSGSGNLEDLQNVDDVIANNKFLYKGSDGIWVGADIPSPTNMVTTNTTQIGLFGDKYTSGIWTFEAGSAAKIILKSVDGAGNNYIQFRDQSGNISGYVGHGSSSNDSMTISRSSGGFISISDAGTRISQLSGSGVRQVVALADGTLSAQGNPTLFLDNSAAGGIGITGGNTVYLNSLGRVNVSGSFDAWANSYTGVRSFSLSGATGLVSGFGAGLYFKRSSGLTSEGSWGIYSTAGVNDKLYYVYGDSTSLGTHVNRTFAFEDWVMSYGLGSLNYNQGWLYTSLNDIAAGNSLATSFIATNISSPPGTLTGFTYPFGIHINASAAIRGDIVLSHASNRMAFRSGGRDLTEVWTTDNFNPSDFSAGMVLERFRDPSFVYGSNNISPYPNATGTVISRIIDSTSPTGIAIRYTATGWEQENVRITFASMITQSAAGKVFIVKMIAKIPVGWEINDRHNATGSGSLRQWVTDNIGTGNYEEYMFRLVCGDTGTFSTGNFFDLRKSDASTPNPSAGNPVVSYLAFATVIETTESFINTRFRIPTTAPTYPLPGDVWVL